MLLKVHAKLPAQEYRPSHTQAGWVETRLVRSDGKPLSGIWYRITEEHYDEIKAKFPKELEELTNHDAGNQQDR